MSKNVLRDYCGNLTHCHYSAFLKRAACFTVLFWLIFPGILSFAYASPVLHISDSTTIIEADGAYIADIIIKGTVKDLSGAAMSGVAVSVKGTTTSVTSDAKGNFSIKIPNTDAILVFSFIGYKTVEQKPGNSKVVNIILTEESSNLSDVVVNVGYGTVSKERLAGAVSSVTAKDIENFPVSSVAEALAGKLAGVAVNSTEGAPGSPITIVVRGGTSITQDNAPLYIVDGFPMDDALTILSPAEIASINVLKDVASTSIYGARGANGVVIITTKSGRKGRNVVSFETYAGVRNITKYLEMLQPYDYVMQQMNQNLMHYNGFLNDTAALNGFVKTYGRPADYEIYKSIPTVDWQKRVFGRSAVSNTQNLSLNGGTDASTYSIIFNRFSEQGIMLASGLDRIFGSFKFESQVSKRFRLGVNARYSNQLVVGAGTSAKGANGSVMGAARFQPYDAVSNFQENDDEANFDTYIDLSTPTTFATRDMSRNVGKQLVSNAFVNVNIVPGLSFRTNVGYNSGQTDNKSFRGVAKFLVTNYSNPGLYVGFPFVNLSKGNTSILNNSNVLTFSKNYQSKHRIDVVLGQEINKYDNDGFTQNIQWLPASVTWESAFANIQQANPPPGSIQAPSFTNVGGERLFSFFGRAMYSYKNRYNLNASFRRDGSSKFAEHNRWANFPSAQFAWRVSEEDFFRNLKLLWVSNLKFRASFGTAGNNRVNGDRLYATTFLTSPSAGGYAVTDNSQMAGYYSASLANPNLKWETTVSRNLGIDVDLFDARFTASIDFYSNTTNDLLLNTNIPQQTGYLTQFQNIGSTRNRGFEIQLAGDVVRKRDFTYNSSFNISFNRNIILALNQGGSSEYGYAISSGWGNIDEDYYVQIGQPVGLLYGYVYDGFYKMEDFDRAAYDANTNPAKPVWVLNKGVTSAQARFNSNLFPGKFKIKDLDGDGVITSADKTILGQYQPKFFGGWNHQFRYKAFDLTVFMNFSYGSKVWNATKMVLSSQDRVNGNNYPAAFKNSFRYFDDKGEFISGWDNLAAANANADIFSPRTGTLYPTSYGVEDASFLRLTNITFGYTLPQKLLQRTRAFSKMRVYATVNNLYTFTGYSGSDPESSTRGTALTPGVDYSAYPRSRYVLAGINLSF